LCCYYHLVLITLLYRTHLTMLRSSLLFFFQRPSYLRHLHSFPTRRSSDLYQETERTLGGHWPDTDPVGISFVMCREVWRWLASRDRKSTRLNSSHVSISYAVFCLKKKNNSNLSCMLVI